MRPRDFASALDQGRSLQPFITRLIIISPAAPGVSTGVPFIFTIADNDALLAYSKASDPATGDCVLRW